MRDSFTVQVDDGHGGTDTSVVNVTIDAVNDALVLDSSKSPTLTAENEDAGEAGPSPDLFAHKAAVMSRLHLRVAIEQVREVLAKLAEA